MNLHQAGTNAEWDAIRSSRHNLWQRIAKLTNGIVTPGNLTSLFGFVLVTSGLNDIRNKQFGRGTAKIVLGRLADVADGIAANKTGTKGPVGEIVDAGLDKIELVESLPVLVSSKALPSPVGWWIGLQNASNAALSAQAKMTGKTIHPSKYGKLTTAVQWGAITSYSLRKFAERSSRQKTTRILHATATTLAVTSIAMGLLATVGYAKDVLKNK